MRVYVETNFLVELLRPVGSGSAERLRGRHPHELSLVVPWCALTEAKRALDRKIQEDLGFAETAGSLLGRWRKAGHPLALEVSAHVNSFLTAVREERRQALSSYLTKLNQVAEALEVIEPSKTAAEVARDLNSKRFLKPFDEMVLGCVLADAAQQHRNGVAPLVFCSLDKRDFNPKLSNDLHSAYAAVGLRYCSRIEDV